MKLTLLLLLISGSSIHARGNEAFNRMKIDPVWYIYVEVRVPKGTPNIPRVTLAAKHSEANRGMDMCASISRKVESREEGSWTIVSYLDPQSLYQDQLSRAFTVETEKTTFLYKLKLELKGPGTSKEWSSWQKADSVENDDACYDFIDGKTTSAHSLKIPSAAPALRYKLRKFSGGTRKQLDEWFDAE